MRSALAAERWWLAWVLGALVVATSAGRWLERLDQVAYDAALQVWQRPASDTLLIVAIDDASLQEIGRWPWTRALHAAAIDRVAAAGAKAVLLDLILAEPDSADPAADTALADALTRAARVVLPAYAQLGADGQGRLVPPQPLLAGAAAAIGHMHLELDSDGVARRVYLGERSGGLLLPHLALAAQRVARGEPVPRFDPVLWRDGMSAPLRLAREQPLLIPFAGPAGHYARVSYAALMRGEIDPGRIAGRTVLIGATAPGLGDAYPTPVSGRGVPMPGVEVMAGVIDALDAGIRLRPAPPAWAAALSVLPLLALLLLAPRLSPRAALPAAALTALVTAALVAAALRAGWWLPPAAALLGVLLVYPLWSWRRLEAASRFLRAELQHHRDDALSGGSLLGAADALAPTPSRKGGDAFANRVDEAQAAAATLRHTRDVFAQSLAGLPAAVAVCDTQRRVILANDAARSLLALGPQGPAALDERLGAIEAGAGSAAPRWRALLDRTLGDGSMSQQPLLDASQRVWLVSVAPYAQVQGASVGAIVTLTEITELQRLQREERDFLQFLSHDLRAPQSSVLSLVDLARSEAPGSKVEALLGRIERQADRSLALIDALLMQQRADRLDSTALRSLDLAQLLYDAADQAWPQARARAQRLSVSGAESSAWVRGHQELLLRAVANLAHNACKYSGSGASIELALRAEGAGWRVAVNDSGPGIASEHLPHLFEHHYRVPKAHPAGTERVEGSGLGLAFVRTVALRHGGSVSVSSLVGQGSSFMLHLPRLNAEPDLDNNEST